MEFWCSKNWSNVDWLVSIVNKQLYKSNKKNQTKFRFFSVKTHNVLFAICNKTSIIKKFEIKMHYDL